MSPAIHPVILAFLATAVSVGCANSSSTAPAPAAAAGTGSATSIDQLTWMSGSWIDLQRGVVEDWTRPVDDVMLGSNRVIVDGQTVFFEVLAIKQADDGIVYLASPRGRFPATRFPLVELESKRAVFENPEHDYPQHIIYWIDEHGGLHSRIEGTEGGEERTASWSFQTVGGSGG